MILAYTNIVIYAASPQYPEVIRFVAENDVAVSAITSVEALGYHALSAPDRASLQRFFSLVSVLPLDQPVLDKAIELRQRRKMGLGDALIAATAVVHQLPLATSDVRDFNWIPELALQSVAVK